MFDTFFGKKNFGERVSKSIEQAFRRDNGREMGRMLHDVFTNMLERAQQEAGMPADLIDQLENSGMSDKAGAIALLDASITGGKNLIRSGKAPSQAFIKKYSLFRRF